MRYVLAVLAATMLMAACASFERNTPEPRVYRLPAVVVPAGPPVDADLMVLEPTVAPGLDTERIASLWPGGRVDYYAGVRWTGALGSTVQVSLVQGARASGRLRTVEGDPGRFRASHVLGVEIERFEADYVQGEPPRARVSMTATLARYADRRALGTWTQSAEIAASANTLSAVTAALGQAYAQAGSELLARALDALAADREST